VKFPTGPPLFMDFMHRLGYVASCMVLVYPWVYHLYNCRYHFKYERNHHMATVNLNDYPRWRKDVMQTRDDLLLMIHNGDKIMSSDATTEKKTDAMLQNIDRYLP
jgi:hypothetical protein